MIFTIWCVLEFSNVVKIILETIVWKQISADYQSSQIREALRLLTLAGIVTPVVATSGNVELLVDHDDRERVTGTGILNLRSRSLANGKDHIIRLVAVSIHQLIICIHRNEMNLSHTYSRNDVHIPAELELHAARTRLAVEHDTQSTVTGRLSEV